MKLCRLKADYHTCCDCIDYQVDNGLRFDCEYCSKRDNIYYPIIKEGKSLFGKKFFIILKDGKEIKIKMDRVFDIKVID